MNSQGKKVYVGLSGGVDSSVSTALLKHQGNDVTGVFIKIWSPEWTECTSKDDRLDAMRVCAHLGIPFKEIDLTKEYKREVVDYMLREYSAGRTPNPDVMCNRFIKFGAFFKWAVKNGADFVATGHYAQITKHESCNSNQFDTCYMLHVAADAAKDQSYFLWTLTQGQLSRTLFPVGGLRKTQVRALAKKFKLPTAQKKDSQGLCFVGHVDIKEFLSRYMPQKHGNALNENGEIIGYHDGAQFLTIGERHGFTISKKTARDTPMYIIAKDVEKNTITVAPKEKVYDISYKSILLSQINWILGNAPDTQKKYEAQIRYHGKRYPCTVNGNTVHFFVKPDALAFGQSLVLYDGDMCLGGGVMESNA